MNDAGIVGLGRVGTALAVSLRRCGYSVQAIRRDQGQNWRDPIDGIEIAVTSLDKAVKTAEVLFITTPDDVIKDIVARLQTLDTNCRAVLHMSGSLTSEILDPLKKKGIIIGTLHPLQSFPNVEQAVRNLPGSYFTYEGDNALLAWVTRLVEQFGGVLKTLPAPDTKVVYHAGAVIVCNYLVGLMQMGMDCLKQAGFSEVQAREALLPLMEGTINNLLRLPPEQALTGPVSRGDVGVIESHLQALKRDLPDVLPSYSTLACVLAGIALRSGSLTEQKYEEIKKLLSGGVDCGQRNSKQP